MPMPMPSGSGIIHLVPVNPSPSTTLTRWADRIIAKRFPDQNVVWVISYGIHEDRIQIRESVTYGWLAEVGQDKATGACYHVERVPATPEDGPDGL